MLEVIIQDDHGVGISGDVAMVMSDASIHGVNECLDFRDVGHGKTNWQESIY